MTTKAKQLRVIFRAERRKDLYVFAILPDVEEAGGMVTTYDRVGGHSSGDYPLVMQNSRAATPAEYAMLFRELARIYGPDGAAAKQGDAPHVIRPVKHR